MIKFFRNIRRRLFEENRLSRYLLYALGEIVLVVIGILIALQINNWNDNRKSRLRINQILTKVHEELALNINNANDITAYYRAKERNIGRVLRKEVTLEDYQNTSLVYLIWNSSTLDLSDDAAKELDGFTELLNEEQTVLVSRINHLYGSYKPTIDVMDQEIEQAVSSLESKLKTTKNWYYLSNDPNNLPKAAFDYFLNDTLYLNDVAYYESTALENHFKYNTFFNNEAKNIYIDLSDYLNVTVDPKLIKPVDSFQDIYGTYVLWDDMKKDTIIISNQNQRIIYEWVTEKGSDTYPLFPESEDEFVIGVQFAQLLRNEQKQPTGFKLTLGSRSQQVFKKIK